MGLGRTCAPAVQNRPLKRWNVRGSAAHTTMCADQHGNKTQRTLRYEGRSSSSRGRLIAVAILSESAVRVRSDRRSRPHSASSPSLPIPKGAGSDAERGQGWRSGSRRSGNWKEGRTSPSSCAEDALGWERADGWRRMDGMGCRMGWGSGWRMEDGWRPAPSWARRARILDEGRRRPAVASALASPPSVAACGCLDPAILLHACMLCMHTCMHGPFHDILCLVSVLCAAV